MRPWSLSARSRPSRTNHAKTNRWAFDAIKKGDVVEPEVLERRNRERVWRSLDDRRGARRGRPRMSSLSIVGHSPSIGEMLLRRMTKMFSNVRTAGCRHNRRHHRRVPGQDHQSLHGRLGRTGISFRGAPSQGNLPSAIADRIAHDGQHHTPTHPVQSRRGLRMQARPWRARARGARTACRYSR